MEANDVNDKVHNHISRHIDADARCFPRVFTAACFTATGLTT
jgi:hypothetical protein